MSIAAARALAEQLHAGQFDKAGNPYFEHPLAVAAAVLLNAVDEHGLTEVQAEVAVEAALLHDTAEDCGATYPMMVKAGVSRAAAFLVVDRLSRRDGEPYFDYVARAGRDPVSRVVKRYDVKNNADFERLKLLDEKSQKSLGKRYKQALAVLDSLEV